MKGHSSMSVSSSTSNSNTTTTTATTTTITSTTSSSHMKMKNPESSGKKPASNEITTPLQEVVLTEELSKTDVNVTVSTTVNPLVSSTETLKDGTDSFKQNGVSYASNGLPKWTCWNWLFWIMWRNIRDRCNKSWRKEKSNGNRKLIRTKSTPKVMTSIISIETTTDTRNTITPLNRASFHLLNTLFPHSHPHWLCIFAWDKQEHCRPYLENLHQLSRPNFNLFIHLFIVQQRCWRRCQKKCCPSFIGPINADQVLFISCVERGLLLTSILLLLKHIIHSLTVLKSTVWCPWNFGKRQWMFKNEKCFYLFFVFLPERNSVSHLYNSPICQNITQL